MSRASFKIAIISLILLAPTPPRCQFYVPPYCFDCFSVSLFNCLTAACLLLLSFNKN